MLAIAGIAHATSANPANSSYPNGGQISATVYGYFLLTTGWRYIDYVFKSGSLISRVSFSGTVVGLTWRFGRVW